MKLTNKAIIKELLPKLRDRLELYRRGEITADDRFNGGHEYIWITKYLYGKYDHATLSVKVKPEVGDKISYEKEYTGCGNGYYASVDWDGNILAAEWD